MNCRDLYIPETSLGLKYNPVKFLLNYKLPKGRDYILSCFQEPNACQAPSSHSVTNDECAYAILKQFLSSFSLESK